jgi:hypothetical protein
MRVVAAVSLLIPCLAGSTAGGDSARVWSFKPDKGFVDDPMAFAENDARFAFIHTDAAQFLTLVLMATDGFRKEAEIKIDPPTLVPRQLAFTPDGSRLVLVWSDGGSGQQGASLYELPGGKLAKKVGPATAATVTGCKNEQRAGGSAEGARRAERSDQQQCVSLVTTRTDAKGNATHNVQAFRASDFKKLGAGSVAVAADQTLRQPPLRLLYFEPGHLQLIGMMKGKYDKKRDIRLPERAVRWSVLTKKELWAEEPKQVLVWVKATNMRPNHAGQYRFLQVSDDLKVLQTVDAQNELGSVALPVKWGLYEPKSLEQAESWDGKTLWFSMTIDPVNAEAVRRKKADRERVDLYRLDPGPRSDGRGSFAPLRSDGRGSFAPLKATPLGAVGTEKRKFRWTVGARHFGYLRKLKGFGRGGVQLELYKIAR